jgi:hypothetical protein
MTAADQADPDLAHHLARCADEKDEALKYVGDVLDLLDRRGRPLDHWERVNLVTAASSLFHGAYRLAAVQANLALTPPDERGAGPALPKDDIYMRADVAMLRQALREVEAGPVEPFPIFGPIVFAQRR